PSAALDYEPNGHEKPQRRGTLPTGFLSIDLALRMHLRIFDPAVRATTGASPYAEVVLSGEKSHYPSSGSAILAESLKQTDGADAKLIVAANGGSDLIYVPSRDGAIVKQALAAVVDFDYTGAVFVDDDYCITAADCP